MAEGTPSDVNDLVNRLLHLSLQRQSVTDEEARYRAAQTAHLTSTTGLREKYAGRAFTFLSRWMGGVGLIVLMQGFGFFGFRLSELVLSTIVGGTAVAVIGLAHAVIKGLFGKPD